MANRDRGDRLRDDRALSVDRLINVQWCPPPKDTALRAAGRSRCRLKAPPGRLPCRYKPTECSDRRQRQRHRRNHKPAVQLLAAACLQYSRSLAATTNATSKHGCAAASRSPVTMCASSKPLPQSMTARSCRASRCPCRELSSHLRFTTPARQSISSPRELDDDAQPSAVPMM